MPKGKKAENKKANRTVPPWGRPEKHVRKDEGLRKFSANVPLGNTDPTVVQGKMYGGGGSGSNYASRSRGNLRQYRGRYS